ncbi:MAG: hypothetical protein KJO10_09705 [Gammaproteobacteria bacterium]|nr:hypothetical protein [Gammaproteobacteria bacterium]
MKVRMFTATIALLVFTGIASAEDNLRGRTIASACFGCHGAASESGSAIPPIIAGAPAKFIEGSLIAFREDRRPSTIMGRIAKGYTDEDIAAVAQYFSAMGGN